MKFLILNGPNLNLLGLREKDIYGTKSYAELCDFLEKICHAEGIDCTVFQSNHEGDLVDRIQQAYGVYDGLILNPAAYTHTSVALLDALKAVSIPTVEVHLSDVNEREEFRKISYVRSACLKTCCGRGFESYKDAILFLKNHITKELKL